MASPSFCPDTGSDPVPPFPSVALKHNGVMILSSGPVALFLVSVALSSAPRTPEHGQREDPIAVMRMISEKSGKGESSFFQERIADEFAGTFISGSVKKSYDKKYIVKNWGAKDSGPSTSEVVSPVATIDHDTAVVRATVVDTSTDAAHHKEVFKTWVTDIYVLRKAKWRLLASTEVLVPPTQGGG